MVDRRTLANAIRILSMDAVQQANSGHPGMPMGMADIAEVLWNDFLRHNPCDPTWPNRDRFVLSNGHGSMLLYSLLHLSGYEVSLDDLKHFRQLHSKTPGHPEYRYTPGVETTTGPLGQGLANAVGMALAEAHLAAHFNQPGFALIDHFTYVFVGDGCLMEGISHEVCSLAGTLGLGKLIVIYDDNQISIDGRVEGWFTDDTPARFRAYGWHVIDAVDGHDAIAVGRAIDQARTHLSQPTLICCKTIIAFGAPTAAGTAHAHGAPLGAQEIALTRDALGWQHPPFVIPSDIYASYDAKVRGAQQQAAWNTLFNEYKRQFPELAAEFQRRIQGALPANWHQTVQTFIQASCQETKPLATRKTSQQTIAAYAAVLPELLGGSADLSGSNGTQLPTAKAMSRHHRGGNYLHYGVREFGMAAIMNGIALHGGFIPFGGTFLVFSDYARNALRLAALMRIKVIFVLTHDSIALGEDGPTHQPVEHLASLRLIPNLSVWRPADFTETAVAWAAAIERAGPTCLILSRQDLPQQCHTVATASLIARGAYVLYDGHRSLPDAILIATGSEVALAVAAANELAELSIRIVSMPSVDVFDQQDQPYRDHVLPPSVSAKIAIEAGSTATWYKYVGAHGTVIGVDRFGVSAPSADVYRECQLTVETIVFTVRASIDKLIKQAAEEINHGN